MNTQIISWLNNKLNINLSAAYYTDYVDVWRKWWQGFYKPFHQYRFSNGKTFSNRKLFTLKMGKKVCEDWASILLNEKTKLVVSSDKTNKFLQGEKETGGILGDNDFWLQANRLIEKAFYSGTGAVVIHARNVYINGSGYVSGNESTKLSFNYLSAEYIIPLSFSGGKITEAAFCSEETVKGKKYMLLELHTIGNDGNYIIENYRFTYDYNSLQETELQAGVAKSINTRSPVPWFSIIMPNIENNVKDNNGLGISVLHGAIDCLQAVDLSFNGFATDFKLGQKKVFMYKDLLGIGEDGEEIVPDDVNQQLFCYIDKDLTGENKKDLIQEFNPELRVDETTKGVQSALDYLSFKVGLGNKHYQFNSGSVVTATQYSGDKQDLIQNAHKHYIAVETFLLGFIKSILWIGKNILNADIDENTDMEIVFDKSVVIDEAAERLQDKQDVNDGVMAKWEYRMKWYGETEEEAKAIINEIEQGSSDDDVMGFGSDA